MIAHRPWKEENRDLRYLWWLSAPMFLVFFFFSFKTNGGQVNWAITAYLSGLVLAAGWLARQLQSPSKLYRRWLMLNVILVSVISLTLMVFVHKPGWLRPIIEPLAGAPSKSNPFPLRKLDPTCRLRGWRFLAQEVNAIRQELRSQGVDPVLAATRWNIPGTVGVYIPDHPTAYCIGRAMGDRHSQYGLWHPNPVDDPEAFIGRTFIIVGGMNNDGVQAFDEIERIRKIVYREEGQPIAAFHVCICRGFRGFSKISNDRH